MNNTKRKHELASYLYNYMEEEYSRGNDVDADTFIEALDAFESVFECEVIVSGDTFTIKNNYG